MSNQKPRSTVSVSPETLAELATLRHRTGLPSRQTLQHAIAFVLQQRPREFAEYVMLQDKEPTGF